MSDTNKGTKITLHWLNQSRSQSIVWLLEELNLSYDLKVYKRQADMLAPPALKEIHPLGKSPVITLENENTSSPMVLAESGVIIEYMCDHFGGDKLVPKRYQDGKEGQVGGETEEWMRHKYFMHYVEGSLMPFLVMQLVMDVVKNPPLLPFFVKPLPRMVASQVEKAFLERNITSNFDFLEQQLKTAPAGGPFLCGNQLSAADIMLSFPVISAAAKFPLKEKWPTLAKYVDLLQEQEGYKRAVKLEETEGKKVEASL
ncbi:putative glutathione S-transferase [Aspergillus campestris IBT 28561]|uniref:glutathione transferase n=1 Tax=Aspergillus campestris (strain IBT 28561) TaxID=1392248 RepID=A0A2I1DHE2_ASPC2|nr:putative glutathione S-transferase [Aspergillus campestris IBT 28561]PKY09288.1 putative glutathione S-transferase [Aspergillus campestris IBT 28561]